MFFLEQLLQGTVLIQRLFGRQAAFGREIAEPGQLLLAQRGVIIRKRPEVFLQQLVVALGVLLAWRCLQRIVGRLQQAVVECAPLGVSATPRCSISPKRAVW